ncbi:MAG: alpha/beta fold hydrolase [Zoogloeaceae bacterium]|jgi:pimeloyl-ACP methyl ester carboxylesterase|nr:alpha/beta fold hydrolase [Zoogloeaceae bacterium]
MPLVHIGALQLATECAGAADAPVMLLIQGLGTPLTRWPQTLVDRLVDAGYRVIRFDNRDMGLSSRLDALGAPRLAQFFSGQAISPLYTLTDMAADAVALLDALHIEKAHVVGASMGGMIGQIVAARYPQRCLSLTSIMSSSGNPLLPPPTPAAQQALIAPLPFPHNEEAIVKDAVRRQQVLMSPGYPTPEAELQAMFTLEFRRGFHPAGVARQLAALMTGGDRRPLLAGIRIPCMVLHGKEDPLIPFACGVDTAKAIPTAELRALPGMGHDFPFALMPQFADAILSAARRA